LIPHVGLISGVTPCLKAGDWAASFTSKKLAIKGESEINPGIGLEEEATTTPPPSDGIVVETSR
jgi:hypothetical protein